MNEIVRNQSIGPGIHRIDLRAPKIARKRRAGQFVIVRLGDRGERVPLTIADSDPEAGTITLVVQAVGVATRKLASLAPPAMVQDLAGPLGHPTHLERFGRVVVVGGGIGTAVALPIARAMRDAGNQVAAIIGARSGEFVILECDMREVADPVVVCTDDGSYGRKGLVTDALQEMITAGETIDHVVAIGPLPMMRAVCEVTRPPGIATTVSLNPIMIDGTGMCGGCRVTVGGEVKFACVDGPEFDGHAVDFAELSMRLQAFREEEAESRRMYDAGCRLAPEDDES